MHRGRTCVRPTCPPFNGYYSPLFGILNDERRTEACALFIIRTVFTCFFACVCVLRVLTDVVRCIVKQCQQIFLLVAFSLRILPVAVAVSDRSLHDLPSWCLRSETKFIVSKIFFSSTVFQNFFSIENNIFFPKNLATFLFFPTSFFFFFFFTRWNIENLNF